MFKNYSSYLKTLFDIIYLKYFLAYAIKYFKSKSEVNFMGCVLKEDRELCMTYNPKIFQLITRKYTLSILMLLDKYGSLRFNELMRKIEGITQRALSIRLKEMEEAKLISRNVSKQKPITVTYSITTQGKAVKNAILMILQLTNLISNNEKDYFA